MRGIAQGKSRLAEALDPGARARLNRRLLERTLSVVCNWLGSSHRCIVISGCRQTLRIARRMNVLPLVEPRPRPGLDHAVSLAMRRAIRCGARAVLVLPSDLPCLSDEALDALADHATYGTIVVIVPDAAGTGTNAVLLKTRARFDFRYGADSRARHVEAARLRGWRHAILTHPDLALDIDVPRDLALWRETTESSRRRMV
jgi:2-phospho-L-lactate guanylyltransferase